MGVLQTRVAFPLCLFVQIDRNLQQIRGQFGAVTDLRTGIPRTSLSSKVLFKKNSTLYLPITNSNSLRRVSTLGYDEFGGCNL